MTTFDTPLGLPLRTVEARPQDPSHGALRLPQLGRERAHVRKVNRRDPGQN